MTEQRSLEQSQQSSTSKTENPPDKQSADQPGPEQPWTRSKEETLKQLEVTREEGLDEATVKKRRQKYGANQLRQASRQSAWDIWVEQFKSMVVLLLIAAAALAMAFTNWIDAIAIMAVVIVNAVIGFVTELRAVRSMESLREMGSVGTKVRREGSAKEVPAEALVPGDIVLFESGDIITADLRLLEAAKLQANESPLTGESVPVTKQEEALAEDTPLAERSNMLYKGTSVTRGAGKGVVVATGMNTELGQISSLVEEAEDESTPLEKRLDRMGRKLVWITLAVAAVVAALGIWQEKDLVLMIETATALAVAAIPEGLPIVATIALARGMHRMAQRNALVEKLAAVETLGGTTVICTDKTGTLTENQMTVTQVALPAGRVKIGGEGLETEGEFSQGEEQIDPTQNKPLRLALKIGVLCNNASLPDEGEESKAVGDPVEVGLLAAGAKAGLRRDDLLQETPEAREVAFDSDTKMMATFHEQEENGYRVAVKGAPEAVLELCTRLLNSDDEPVEMGQEQRQEWMSRNQEMAEDGLRVLALATKTVDSVEAEPYEGLTFVGLLGLLDPPREEVRPAITAAQEAGVRVVMVTGDHPITARNIGREVGLVAQETQTEVIHGRELKALSELSEREQRRIVEAAILARVSPEQKLNLIEIHQASGDIVAMTGDGVNDAPALKSADIGVAMGQRGTQVAKEAADMVLQDDAFSTIVVAIEQGRVIFNNIRKFVLFLHSGNSCKIIAVGLASLINAPLPILPLQILYLNVITDVFPALALGVGEGDPSIMKHPPRDPEESIVTNHHWWAIAQYGMLITLTTLGALGIALSWLQMPQEQAITISFLTLAFAQLWNVFNMRDNKSGLISNEVSRNPYIWGSLVLCAVLLLGAVYVPGLSNVLSVVDPGLDGWLLILGMSFIPLVVGTILKKLNFIKT